MKINAIKFHKDDPKDGYNINVDISITMTWEEMLTTNMNPDFKERLQKKIQEAINHQEQDLHLNMMNETIYFMEQQMQKQGLI